MSEALHIISCNSSPTRIIASITAWNRLGKDVWQVSVWCGAAWSDATAVISDSLGVAPGGTFDGWHWSWSSYPTIFNYNLRYKWWLVKSSNHLPHLAVYAMSISSKWMLEVHMSLSDVPQLQLSSYLYSYIYDTPDMYFCDQPVQNGYMSK